MKESRIDIDGKFKIVQIAQLFRRKSKWRKYDLDGEQKRTPMQNYEST